MKVGSIVYATEQGLGNLAKDFYDNHILDRVCLQRHHHYVNHNEWYRKIDASYYSSSSWNKLLKECDVFLFFETPFYWNVFDEIRRAGKKSLLMVMYECMPTQLPSLPDAILCPSRLDLYYYSRRELSQNCEQFVELDRYYGVPVYYTPVPIPRWINWHQRNLAITFVHNAGRGGLQNRNGTGEVIDAWKHVKNDAKLILRSQNPLKWGIPQDDRISVRIGSLEERELYNQGDVFLFPEKFNGLSLPLQESYASGMMVMATDRFPNNTYLPIAPLVRVKGYEESRVSGRCFNFQKAIVDPQDIAAKVDEWYGRDISTFSLCGYEYSQELSWEKLGPRYKQMMESLQ